MKRRDILKGSLAAGALALLPKGGAQGAPQNVPSLGRRYRNLIVFVYDGFSWEDYAIAQAYARRRLGRALALERLLARYPNGLMNTYSLTSYVTESSAAGNAMSCGVKTVNGGLAVHADGTPLKPFFSTPTATPRPRSPNSTSPSGRRFTWEAGTASSTRIGGRTRKTCTPPLPRRATGW